MYTIYSIVGFTFLGQKISYYEFDGATTEALMSKYNYFTNTSHTPKGRETQCLQCLRRKNTIMPPTTAPRRHLRALSDSLAGC